MPDEPVIHIDDSDVVKPDGYKFESIGIVRDGSESTSTKKAIMSQRHVYLRAITILSVFFPKYTLLLKRLSVCIYHYISGHGTGSSTLLEEQSFVWAADMAITKCRQNRMS